MVTTTVYVPSNCNQCSFDITENLAETFPSEDYLPIWKTLTVVVNQDVQQDIVPVKKQN